MNDFILDNLKKLKKNKIPNPEIDLRILLNYSRLLANEIVCIFLFEVFPF